MVLLGVLINPKFLNIFYSAEKRGDSSLKFRKLPLKKKERQFFFPAKNVVTYRKFSVNHEPEVRFFILGPISELKTKLRATLRTWDVLSLHHVFWPHFGF